MDNPKKLVHEHCKKLLLNLLANLCPNFENCRYAALMIDTSVAGLTCLLPTTSSSALQQTSQETDDQFCLTDDGGPCKPTLYISTRFAFSCILCLLYEYRISFVCVLCTVISVSTVHILRVRVRCTDNINLYNVHYCRLHYWLCCVLVPPRTRRI